MPTITNIFPSKYLSAADLQNKDVVVTIDRVEMEEFDDNGRKVTKPVVYFQESAKAMIFNKTNATTVADITGQANTDNWGGAQICLYSTMVQFGAKMTEAIRVKRPPDLTVVPTLSPPLRPTQDTVSAEATSASAATAQFDDDLDDEITL